MKLNIIQYDFFEEKPTEIEEIRLELEHYAKSSDKVRRGTYASINELRKIILEIKEDVDLIKRHICQKPQGERCYGKDGLDLL